MKRIKCVIAVIILATFLTFMWSLRTSEQPQTIEKTTTEIAIKEKPLNYWQQIKNYTFDFYNRHQNIIKLMALGIATVAIGKVGYDMLEAYVKEGYRRMRIPEGQDLMKGPKGTESQFSHLSKILDRDKRVYRYPTLQEVNKIYNIDIPQETYDAWIKYMEEEYKPFSISNIEEGWKY